jgi:AcrR family transcriptional regulator
MFKQRGGIMSKETFIKEKILNKAEEKMIKFGYRKVTMDDIATDLVMSKNTIYKYFQSKEDIAKCLIKRLQQQLNIGFNKIEKSEKDPLKAFSDSVLLLRKRLGPWFDNFFRDIPTELPSLWEEFLRFRNEKILNIQLLVGQGIKKGVFRRVNPSIAVQAYLGAIKAIIGPKFLEEESITFDQALDEIIDIWSNGILINKQHQSKEEK